MLRIVSVSLLLLGLSCVSATTVYESNGFCQRYAAALFPTDPSPGDAQYQLIAAVIDRALNGNSLVSPVVNGILNDEIQKQYFNGSYSSPAQTNFYTNVPARLVLRQNLITFFGIAMGCRDNASTTYNTNMGAVHAAMNINKETWTDFVNQVANTLYSFGVPSTTIEPSETNYVLALLGQFNRGNPAGSICTAASCDFWTGFAEFWSGSDDVANPGTQVKRWLNSTGGYTVTIPVNGKVHWNIGTIHAVQQCDSTFSTDMTGSGTFSTNGVGLMRTYTVQFTTPGTYYFYCIVPAHKPTMRGTIYVQATTTSSTGGSGAGTTVPALAVVLGTIAAGLALRRRL